MDVPEVQLADTTSKRLWQDYVSQRQPVVIHGVADCWSNFSDDTLLEKAGDAVVMVEHRRDSSDAYGQGKKGPMQLRELIAHLQKGDSNLYMSTQEVGVGHDGHPLLYGPPLVDMEGCFPLQQPLLPHLVPQSINMWMGCAPEGSSSGLHHDFHDNLYVLLRGTKRFRLFPPSSAPDMYVTGIISQVYPNGRIVYEGQGDVLPDGSNVHDVNVWRAHNAADKAAAAAAAASDASEAERAEALLEQQLEQMLDEGAGDGTGDGLIDDYLDSDTPDAGSDSDNSDSDSAGRRQRQRQQRAAGRQQHQQQLGKASATEPGRAASAAAAAAAASVVEPPPPSFSQVPLDAPESQLRKQYPRFPGLAAASVVVLQAGDMLFLPAGWFHEVTSYGGPGLDGGHLAINYWFHPPDNLDPGKAGLKQPYSSPYYPSVWANRRSWIQAETRAWWQQQQQKLQAGPSEHTSTQQQQQQQQDAGDAGRATKRRRIQWAPTVADPGNVYEAFNTRPGTATGSCKILPQHSGLRDPSAPGSDDADEEEPGSDSAPDDEQAHHQLGKEVADGIEALEAYFGENPDAMRELLGQFLAERRALLAAGSRGQGGGGAGPAVMQLPHLMGRRHHYTVVCKLERRRAKPKPAARRR